MKIYLITFILSLFAFTSCINTGAKATEENNTLGERETEAVTDDVRTWIVASRMANCTGVAPQKCLLIKENREDDWQFHYSGIEGFDYEPGYEYVLRIRLERVENPPMDASSIRFVLEEVVSKTPGESDDMPPAAD